MNQLDVEDLRARLIKRRQIDRYSMRLAMALAILGVISVSSLAVVSYMDVPPQTPLERK
jgi:hypothetical protein